MKLDELQARLQSEVNEQFKTAEGVKAIKSHDKARFFRTGVFAFELASIGCMFAAAWTGNFWSMVALMFLGLALLNKFISSYFGSMAFSFVDKVVMKAGMSLKESVDKTNASAKNETTPDKKTNEGDSKGKPNNLKLSLIPMPLWGGHPFEESKTSSETEEALHDLEKM